MSKDDLYWSEGTECHLKYSKFVEKNIKFSNIIGSIRGFGDAPMTEFGDLVHKVEINFELRDGNRVPTFTHPSDSLTELDIQSFMQGFDKVVFNNAMYELERPTYIRAENAISNDCHKNPSGMLVYKLKSR